MIIGLLALARTVPHGPLYIHRHITNGVRKVARVWAALVRQLIGDDTGVRRVYVRYTLITPDELLPRHLPFTRSDCPDLKDGPCPYVSCRHHLFLDVDREGEIRFTQQEPFDEDGAPRLDAMKATCALDVVGWDNVTLETIGSILDVSFERVRQLEVRALEHLRVKLARLDVHGSHRSSVTFSVFDNPYTDGDEG